VEEEIAAQDQIDTRQTPMGVEQIDALPRVLGPLGAVALDGHRVYVPAVVLDAGQVDVLHPVPFAARGIEHGVNVVLLEDVRQRGPNLLCRKVSRAGSVDGLDVSLELLANLVPGSGLAFSEFHVAFLLFSLRHVRHQRSCRSPRFLM
jgi:hypothetical protein